MTENTKAEYGMYLHEREQNSGGFYTEKETKANIAVVQTEIYGVKAWHIKCLKCGTIGKRKDTESEAIKNAKAHGLKCLTKNSKNRITQNGASG